MISARRAFLAGLIDYAGLFPPARLPLEPAAENHARYLAGPDAWMLARFILPGARLPELDETVDLIAPATLSEPVRLSVLGLPREGDAGLAEVFAATAAAARETESRHPGRLTADRYELRAETADPDRLVAELGAIHGAMREGDGVAVEVPLVGEGASRDHVEGAAHAVAEANARAGRRAIALKLRCGGVTPDAFPSVESLAHALAACLRANAPFKATAGLHHPVRQHRDEVGARMHGFLNVFGGAILARTHGLDADALAEILDDEDPAHFRLDDSLGWRSLTADGETVRRARDADALSYGSCSFDEPREDLRDLGLLAPAA